MFFQYGLQKRACRIRQVQDEVPSELPDVQADQNGSFPMSAEKLHRDEPNPGREFQKE